MVDRNNIQLHRYIRPSACFLYNFLILNPICLVWRLRLRVLDFKPERTCWERKRKKKKPTWTCIYKLTCKYHHPTPVSSLDVKVHVKGSIHPFPNTPTWSIKPSLQACTTFTFSTYKLFRFCIRPYIILATN